jgi:hypothetical protein
VTSQPSIADELSRLWKGRGIFARDLPSRCGSNLRSIFGIGQDDDWASIHRKVSKGFNTLAADLPTDLQLAVLVSMALHPDARYRSLQERQAWLADQWACDARTVRRRLAEAVEMMSSIAIERSVRPPESGKELGYAEQSWYLERFRVLLRMDRSSPEAFEERTVVATQAGLSQVVTAVGVPKQPYDKPTKQALAAEVEYGGQLFLDQQTSDSYFKYVIQFPRSLALGERHEFGMTIHIPEGQEMAPLYAPAFIRRCDRFELRIRFDATRQPSSVWRITEVPQQVALDFNARDDQLTLDTVNEVFVSFADLKQGLAYGIQWAW